MKRLLNLLIMVLFSILTIAQDPVKDPDPIMKSEFFLYPNPSDGLVNIVSKNLLNEDLLIEVRDINNRPVLVRRFSHLDSGTNIEINVSDISPGIYFINFITGDTRTVEILSKQ